jgi:soluble P-type ATPase
MTLATTAQGKGVDAIAAAWAASREVPLIAFRLNRAHGNAAPFRRNKLLVGLQPIEAIICEGSGVQANLAEAMRAAHIAVTIFRKEERVNESRRAA